ncbi:vacuolar-type H+-ATPase subunit E/Vma4 [Lachnotalea glycerini]|uniref:ATPase n=1 Tax=Lachnotalea glycerini TaxID=1763509 RepID=A0A255IC82_9FIRM|nr:V-type ATP synthase subunit E [Lachnotalea glycerini]PXV85314.1 vacuolar-type H+-ATPase subunit E/Vma4 [Lachnotalea glycerini]RDY29881.1 ATPase [Lachnotalea glycerini]
MTIEEKLQHFQDFTMQDARDKSNQMLDEYSASLDKIFEEHREKKLRQAQLEIKTQTESLKHDRNKELSKQHLHIKRNITKKQENLKEKLFVEVKDLLCKFMESAEYNQLLISQIKAAKNFAKDQNITIYLDPADSSRRSSLEVSTNTMLTVSKYSFIGGIRAIIPDKNILIDNSFETKLSEAKANFTFNGGISND